MLWIDLPRHFGTEKPTKERTHMTKEVFNKFFWNVMFSLARQVTRPQWEWTLLNVYKEETATDNPPCNWEEAALQWLKILNHWPSALIMELIKIIPGSIKEVTCRNEYFESQEQQDCWSSDAASFDRYLNLYCDLHHEYHAYVYPTFIHYILLDFSYTVYGK